uniref:Sodium/potassium-transporting ATPase subunit beta n=1 Tax=Esox lucius TaxID=8010 RepID=A0AAY5KRB3_ESOLU
MNNKEDERADTGAKEPYFWNPRTHEFLGRTASSWGLILLFYLVFYIFLGGMFILTMYVMLLTLDDYKPTYQDRLATPGMMIRPRSEAMEILYNPQDTESWDRYTEALDIFLAPYNNSVQVQNNDDCLPDNYFIQEDSGEVRNNPKRSCQFNRTSLDACSGIIDRTYGYQTGQPCVLIKLNRVIGMLPGKDGQSPYVTCGAKTIPQMMKPVLEILDCHEGGCRCDWRAGLLPPQWDLQPHVLSLLRQEGPGELLAASCSSEVPQHLCEH